MNNHWQPYPGYRHSAVEWLGEVPTHWETRRLKYAATVNPESLPEDCDPDYDLQYVDIGSVDSTGRILDLQELSFEKAPSRARRKVKHGDTIISTVRTYLRAIAYLDHPPSNLIASTGFAVLRPNKQEVDPPYLWRLVQSSGFVDAVIANSVGIGYPAIPSTRLGELFIWIPPLPEQRAIAAFLDRETAKIDTLVRKQERLIELLEEKRAALISHVVTRGLGPDAQTKHSGIPWLGEIPEQWETANLWAVAHLQRGHDLPSGEREPGEVPVISSSGVSGYHSEAKEQGPGVVTGRYGTIGDVFYVDQEYWPLNTALYVREFHGNHPRYVYYLLQILPFDAFSGKSAVPGVDRKDLHGLEVVVPPIVEQRAIATHLDREIAEIDWLISKVQTMIERLQEYRTALISAAVTGKIDVREEAPPA